MGRARAEPGQGKRGGRPAPALGNIHDERICTAVDGIAQRERCKEYIMLYTSLIALMRRKSSTRRSNSCTRAGTSP
jgi:hypothetical protein